MTAITTHELQKRLPDMLARLAAGEEFILMDAGRPVAQITGLSDNGRAMPSDEAIARSNAAVLSHQLSGPAPGGIDNEAIDRDLAAEYNGHH